MRIFYSSRQAQSRHGDVDLNFQAIVGPDGKVAWTGFIIQSLSLPNHSMMGSQWIGYVLVPGSAGMNRVWMARRAAF
jgi:hypothetical protein